MNVFDLVFGVLLASAAVAGYRLGFLARALSWAGMVAGFFLASRALPSVVERFDGPDPTVRLLIAAGVLLGSALVGQGLGLFIGSRARLALRGPIRPLDHAAGALAGALGVLVAVWLLLPAMAQVPGSVARLTRTSRIAQAIDAHAPAPPDTLQALRTLVGEGPFPQVFSALRPAPEVGPPPDGSGLSPTLVATAAASTVRVEGRACGRIQEGSGFVAGPGIVVTNAHVVAGEDETALVRQDGRRVAARVVSFDADRDLAVLAAPDVGAPQLAIGDGAVGTTGGVFGYPGGGGLEVSPFAVREEVDAQGRDLYGDERTLRAVLVLAADLAPGDSGAALLDAEGLVVGVAFAIAPDQGGTAYALAPEELEAALSSAGTEEVDTGPCI